MTTTGGGQPGHVNSSEHTTRPHSYAAGDRYCTHG